MTSVQSENASTYAQPIPRAILTTPEAAAYLGLAISTLNKWRCYGEGPQFVKLGRAVRYRQDDLDHFIESGMRGSVDEA